MYNSRIVKLLKAKCKIQCIAYDQRKKKNVSVISSVNVYLLYVIGPQSIRMPSELSGELIDPAIYVLSSTWD